jgi:hypothetical protein
VAARPLRPILFPESETTVILSTLLITTATKLLAAGMKRSGGDPAPACDGCSGSLPAEYRYTKCCGTKLCPRCVELYKERSPVRCCVCRNPH